MNNSNQIEFQIEARENDTVAITDAMGKKFPGATVTFVHSDSPVPEVLRVFVPHGHPSLGMREQLPDGTFKEVSTEVLLHAACSVLVFIEQNRI